ncbi:MAG: hypothetical protein GXO78_11820 [Calditrichaeota bacterium]|nr:hypothetical protein [Calditrichota bacterium]
MKNKTLPVGFLSILFILLLLNCDTGIEPSPSPGILRVTLQSDPADTIIVIVKDTFVVAEKDSFGVTIFQGRVYSGETYAVLYPTLKSYKQEDRVYNIIRREAGGYYPFTIFETYVPPGKYDRIQFGLKAHTLKLKNFDEIKVEAPENANPIVSLEADFRVEENQVTEINVYIQPFQSVQRYRDIYQFIPRLQVVGVQYLGQKK